MTENLPVSLWRGLFSPGTRNGKIALASALLFVVTPSLAFLASKAFLVLLLPAALLSAAGLREQAGRGEAAARRLAQTGFLMAFNGTVLVLAMFVLGFIEDFLSAGRSAVRSETVALGFTTVHVMLGVGLLVVDHYRHRHES